MISGAKAQLIPAILQADALHIGRIILYSGGRVDRIVVRIAVKIEAASLQRELEVLARREGRTGNLIIKEQVAVQLHRELAEFYIRVAVLAVSPDAFQLNLRILTAAMVVLVAVLGKIRRGIETGVDMPVVVDFRAWFETEQQLIIVYLRIRRGFIALAGVGVASLAVPFHHVGIALEIADADTEVVELIGEFRGQFVDQRLVRAVYVALSHRLGDHLRHLIARDVLVALERRIAVAFDDAVGGQLAYRIVCPVVRRYIGKRVGRRKRRGCRANNKCRSECRNKCLFHNKLLHSSSPQRRKAC